MLFCRTILSIFFLFCFLTFQSEFNFYQGHTACSSCDSVIMMGMYEQRLDMVASSEQISHAVTVTDVNGSLVITR